MVVKIACCRILTSLYIPCAMSAIADRPSQRGYKPTLDSAKWKHRIVPEERQEQPQHPNSNPSGKKFETEDVAGSIHWHWPENKKSEG